MKPDHGDLWVFGYGSLMWRPGFVFEESQPALVRGYHRSLCIFSHVHRGTPEKPGLVLGLDRGGACRGQAFRVTAGARHATLSYLREREQVTSVYREVWLDRRLTDGRIVPAVMYVVDRSHPQYAGRLSGPDLVRLVSQGHGVSGANIDYVTATHRHLVAAGIRDHGLAWIVEEATRRPGD
ncbi:MAG: gamma-glutamylcyclotransferase [Beijerinckiaceae bacterium]|nr:gamma-glutamylcyclotransferase [Beijerinckiaceae bacterium]